MGLAEVLLRLGNVDGATPLVSRAEQLAPQEARRLRGWLALLRWDKGKGDPNTAFRELRKAARAKGPMGAHAGMLLLEIYARQGDRKGAEATYRVLKQRFGDELSFWGGAIDTQHILPVATPQQVAEHVAANIKSLKPGGGYVFNNVHNIQAGVPPQNMIALFDAAYDHGFYH